MSKGVGGAVVVNGVGICKEAPMSCMCLTYLVGPMDVVWWWMHKMLRARLSVRGSILNSGGMVGSSYVTVSAMKWVITCESGKVTRTCLIHCTPRDSSK